MAGSTESSPTIRAANGKINEQTVEGQDDNSPQDESHGSQHSTLAPDGGFYAWLSVIGSGLVMFNSWGLVQAFGAYQSYYVDNSLRGYDASTISWIGTLQAFLLVVVGIITGPIFDQGYLRSLLLVGGFLVVFGLMMLSLATKYYQILLAQAICVGLGSGCIFTPAVAQLAVVFNKRRTIAIGLATAGTNLGGVVYPIVFDQLEPHIGFGWTTRVIGFIALATLVIATVILTWKKPIENPPRSLFDMTALKDVTFIVYTMAIFFMYTAFWVPWFYIPLFGQYGAGASASFSFYLLSITNAASIVGRTTGGFIQPRANSLYLLIGSASVAGIILWSWISIHQFGNFVVFCVMWGLFSGCMATVAVTVIPELTPRMNVVGARMGMAWSVSAFGTLIGSPVASTLSNPRHGKFLGAQVFAASCMVAAVALYMGVVVLKNVANRRKIERGTG